MRIANLPHSERGISFARFPAQDGSLRARRNHTMLDDVCYKVASLLDERNAAFQLVYDAYTASGLMPTSDAGIRFDFRHLLPSSPIFVAESESTVVCTMSLFPDSGMGLLLERAFEREIAGIRKHSSRIAEVSCLASLRGHFQPGRMFDVFVNLVGLMFHYAQFHGIEALLIAVHPKHARFYQRMLGFEIIGQQRPYGRVGRNPAVACVHDFRRVRANGYPLLKRIDRLGFQPWELVHRPMTASERQFFMAKSMVVDRLCAA